MRFRPDFYFQTSVDLLLAVGFIVLASTGKVDVPTILCFVSAYLAYSYFNFKGRPVLLSPQKVSVFSRIYVLVFLADLVWLSGSFVNSAIHLLIFIQVLKLYSEKKDKDYFYMILIAFMELLAAAAITISPLFFIWFLLFLALVISTLVSFEMKRTQEKLDPTCPERQVVRRPAGVIGRPSGRGLYMPLAVTSVILSFGIIGVAFLIFFALPRVEGGFFNRLNAPTQGITGFSPTVQFGDVGSIKKNMALVMRVVMEGDPGQFEGVKWRGIALNEFQNNTWYRHLGNVERLVGRDLDGFYRIPMEQVSSPHQLVRYSIVLEPLSTDIVFAAARVRLIQTRARLRADSAGTLATEFHPNSRLRYDVVTDLEVPSPVLLRAASSDYLPEIVRYYLKLPPLDPRMTALAKEITTADRNNYDRARSLEDYLKSHYSYTLDLPRIRESDPIGQFLFETRRGHCEYFASSMALMLRILKIPSRVVNGFQTGEYNAVGKDFIVREADAHSWVEAYFPGHGWVAFDPTPASASPKHAGAWMILNHCFDALELFWINWVVGYDSYRQVSLFQDLQRESLMAKQEAERVWLKMTSRISNLLKELFFTPAVTPAASIWKGWARKWVPWSGFLLVIVLAGWGFRRWAQWRQELKSPRAQAVSEAFMRWLRALSRRGYSRRRCQTPLEFSQSIHDPVTRALSVELTQRYNILRFQPFSPDPCALREFRTRLQEAIRSL
jgi:transglutaminase-like putative cysteine protease